MEEADSSPAAAAVVSEEDLTNRLIPLLRTDTDALNTYLVTVACGVVIDETNTRAHCNFVALDGNQRPRINDFARFVGTRITNFAIPRSEINRALEEGVRMRSTAPVDRLNSKARSLFSKAPKSGEGGEVVLSLLTEHYLRLPQLFTKMVLKTNREVHVHGCDGIHAGVNRDNGNLAIYWGESKLYRNPSDGIREAFASLAPFLQDSGGTGASQDRDIHLMRDGLELDDQDLEEALKHYLDPDDARFNQLEFRGVCLVGFDSEAYPTQPNSRKLQELHDEIEVAFNDCKKQIQSRVTTERIASFEIELFCLPFPSVDDFRKAFRHELGFTDGQD